MSSLSTPVMNSTHDEIVPESPLVTPPRSPKFMPISADRTAEIEFSEEFDSSEDEPEHNKEKTSDDESQPTATLPTLAEVGNEVTKLHLRLGQDEQRIAELEHQIAIMKDAKRKWQENPGESSGQQQVKRQRTVNIRAAGQDVKKKYKGKKPHCNKCKRHHTGHCGTPCRKCKRYGHRTKNCRSIAPTAKPVVTPGNPKACYECGDVGHLKAQCGNLKNQNKNKKNSTRGANK